MEHANKFLAVKSNIHVGLDLYQAGYEECSSHHSFGPVVRDFFVLHFIVDGAGYLEINNNVYNLKKGDLFLIPKHSVSRYYVDNNNPYKYFWIGFSGVNDVNLLNAIGFNSANNCYVIHCGDNYNEILSLLSEIHNIDDATSLKSHLSLSSMLIKLFSILVNKDIKFKDSNDRNEALDIAVKYIEKNFASHIDMKILENVTNMHRSNIYRLFLNNFGISPTEYIRNSRLENALYLLKNTDYSIKKISVSCGFSDSVYFCKVFKNVYKKTPSDTRHLQ